MSVRVEKRMECVLTLELVNDCILLTLRVLFLSHTNVLTGLNGLTMRGGGGVQQRGRRDSCISRRSGPSADPKKVCKMYLKGLCRKSHQDCPMIHNPTCWHFSRGGGCHKGGDCLFPHRDPAKSGQLVSRQNDSQAPVDEGGKPQAKSQAKAKAKATNGKNKNEDPAVQAGHRTLGETVISFSFGLDCKPELESGQNEFRSVPASSTELLGANR